MDDEQQTISDPIERIAKEVFGYSYIYPWQRMIIASVADAILFRDNSELSPLHQIAVLPTGAGKSLCWMLPAFMQNGITVAVFPLLSLMSDQERRLNEAGIASVMLRGGQASKLRNSIWKRLENGSVKIILTNPELLQVVDVRRCLGRLNPSFLVIDETHTVSQWGETFRPACAQLGSIIEEWHPQAVLALTATAGVEIREKITQLLFNGEQPRQALADPDRPAVHYGVLPTLSRNHTLERLVREEIRPIIIFGPTRATVVKTAQLLRTRLYDENIRYYHAGLSRDEKKRTEEWFLDSDDGILTATSAYGLGVDKKNIRTVIHLAPPSSTEAYLQESGRASRDGKGANAWLICTSDDSFVNDKIGNLEVDLGQEVLHDAERARRQGMQRYITSSRRCRREILLETLGCVATDCSGCDVCGGQVWHAAPEKQIVLNMIRQNRKRFRKGQLARVLIGRRSEEIFRAGLDTTRGFAVLSGWELEDAEEAIGTLLRSNSIAYSKRGKITTVPNSALRKAQKHSVRQS